MVDYWQHITFIGRIRRELTDEYQEKYKHGDKHKFKERYKYHYKWTTIAQIFVVPFLWLLARHDFQEGIF